MPRVPDAEDVVRDLERARVDQAEVPVGNLKVPKFDLLNKGAKSKRAKQQPGKTQQNIRVSSVTSTNTSTSSKP